MAKKYKAKVYLTSLSNTKNYTFAFDYINKTYVKVKVGINSPALTYGTDYVVQGHIVELVNVPPTDTTLVIYRETPTDQLVEWYDSSILRAKDLNLYSVQLLHINEENMDKLLDSGIQEDKLDNKWNGLDKVLKNLGDPVEPQDAVTLGFLTKTQDSFITQAQGILDNTTEQASMAVENRNHIDNVKSAIDDIKADIDSQHKHIHQDLQEVREHHEHIHGDVEAVARDRELVAEMQADVSSMKDTVTSNYNGSNEVYEHIKRVRANVDERADFTKSQAEKAKEYADKAQAITGLDTYSRAESDEKFLTKVDNDRQYQDIEQSFTQMVDSFSEMGSKIDTNTSNIENNTSMIGTLVSENATQGSQITDLQNIVQNLSNTTLERNATYKVGDIVYHKDLPAGYYLECTVGGTTGNTQPNLKVDLSTLGG